MPATVMVLLLMMLMLRSKCVSLFSAFTGHSWGVGTGTVVAELPQALAPRFTNAPHRSTVPAAVAVSQGQGLKFGKLGAWIYLFAHGGRARGVQS